LGKINKDLSVLLRKRRYIMFAKLFLDHPNSVNKGYFKHARFALLFSALLMIAAIAALVHAIIPAAFEKTASQIVRRLFEKSKTVEQSSKFSK